tara:strand:- start:68 stop:442 length:375 start_codon:yes stop_codon:yes gene_type:complete
MVHSPAYNNTLCILGTLKHFNLHHVGLSAGETWESIEFDDPTIEKPPKEEFDAKFEELLAGLPFVQLRKERNTRLLDTDYTATADYPHPTPEIRQAWIDYRQALRDLPANTVDPLNPIWPTPPA